MKNPIKISLQDFKSCKGPNWQKYQNKSLEGLSYLTLWTCHSNDRKVYSVIFVYGYRAESIMISESEMENLLSEIISDL